MALGSFTWFDKALIKIANGTISLTGTNFKAVLATFSQPMSKSFAGSSGAAKYSDLTAELATANGYTNSGLAMSGFGLVASGSSVTWSSAAMSWTLTGAGLTFRYLIIYDNSGATKDLLCFLDMDTSSGSNITVAAGPLVVTPNPSILGWSS